MLKLYNTLTRKIEDFKPINPGEVGMYSCGPTVYDYQHIGHMRRYVGDDILVRVLQYNKYKTKHVMNITDVGHLVSDADTGEDKMEKGAKKFGMSVWDIAKKFEQQFFDSMHALKIVDPNVLMHATKYIDAQIELVEILEEKGFTYKTSDGVYFDTSKFKNYFKLSGQNPKELKAWARVGMVEGKKNISDFALWKFSYSNGRSFDSAQDDSVKRRRMEWESPWGVGFPGWHVECSAMSMLTLGPQFDIHTGGIDHISIHHTNEIAQSEAATGRQFVNYWVHHAFLMAEGKKMSKSIGNIYTVEDIIKKGFDPMVLRYLYLQTHYRQEMNFTWEALSSAQTALNRLRQEVASWGEPADSGCLEYEEIFDEAINDDLNMPKALAVVWELVKSNYENNAKVNSLYKMDEVLGLSLKDTQDKMAKKEEKIPDLVLQMVEERNLLRKGKRFHLADQLRNKVKKMGFEILDDKDGTTKVRPL